MTTLERYHLTLTTGGRPAMHGWWPDASTAERRFSSWIGDYSSLDGARITLVDTADDGRVIHSWPDES